MHVVASGDPLLHGVGGTLIRLFGARPRRGAAARVVGDAGVLAARLGGAGHRGDQPGHAPNRTPRCGAADRPSCCRRDGASPGRAGPAAHRHRPRRLRDHGARATRRAGASGAASATAREWAARPPGDVDALNVVAVRYLPDDRAVRGAARRCVRPRRSDHQAVDARGHAGGAGAAARRAAVGRRRGFGQHRDRVVPQRIPAAGQWRSNATSNAASGSPRTRWRFGAKVDVRGATRRRRAVRRSVTACRPSAIFIGGGLTQPGLLEACYRTARRPAAGWSPTPSPRNPKPFSRSGIPDIGGELRRFQHYRGEPVGGFTGWRPAMPVTQWSVTKR